MSDSVTLYNTRTIPPTEESVNLTQLFEDMRYSIYRFWVNERRMPTAVIVPLQLAQKLSTPIHQMLGTNLYYAGIVDEVPILAHESYIDPLFRLI